MKRGVESPHRERVKLPTRQVKDEGTYTKGTRQRIGRHSEGNVERWSRQTVILTCGHQVTLVDKSQAYAPREGMRDHRTPWTDKYPTDVPCAICYSEGKTT